MGVDAKFQHLVGDIPHAKIRGALRKIWLWSPQRRAALKRAKWNGTRFYRCQECHLPTEKPEVDHVVPVGKTPGAKGALDASWDFLIARLFVHEDGLRVLCRPCHQNITQAQKGRTEKAS